MSATKAGCQKQVWRVMQFCKAARDDEALEQVAKEILFALLRNCQSDEHAEQAVTRFIESKHFAGDVIADLVAIAQQTQQHDQPPAGCSVCEIGSDISTGAVLWGSHVFAARPDGVTYAKRCECPRGLWFTKRDAERGGAVPSKPVGKLERPDVRKLAAGDE